MADARRRRYVPLDVYLPFGSFGTRLLERWEMDGLCTWMLFLAACKREQQQGTFAYTSEVDGWSKLGAETSRFTLTEFFKFTGDHKKTSRRRHGRITYVVCSRWESWNTPRTVGEKSSKPKDSTEEIPDDSAEIPQESEPDAHPEVEVEVEVENEKDLVPLAFNGAGKRGRTVAHATEQRHFNDPQPLDFMAMAERAMRAKAQVEEAS